MAEMDDDELLAALGVETAPLSSSAHTPLEERIISGFEDIIRFHQRHGRAPEHGDGRDIFERLYAVRLDQLRKLTEAHVFLAPLDTLGLLAAAPATVSVDKLDGDELLAALGIDAIPDVDDIRVLRHVRSHAEIKAAEEVASRVPCIDFDNFSPLFEEVKVGLKMGAWLSQPFGKDASIEPGDFFIVGGQIAFVAELKDGGTTKDGRDNPRLRVIFDNQTEADLLLRSLSRSLYPDGDAPVGRRLLKVDAGPLFGDSAEAEDIETGSIYVLRSRSDHPFVAQHRELIHKIGVTGGKVEARISGAENDATYLLAGVDIVAEYKLHNINRTKLENIFHRVFGAAQLELTIADRFGNPVRPREWFLAPLHVIDDVVQRIKDGSIPLFFYDPKRAELVLAGKEEST